MSANKKTTTPTRLLLGKRNIEAIKPPVTGLLRVFDSRVPGFCVLVTPSGAKTFYSYRKIGGRPTMYKLGRCDEITAEAARKLAERYNGRLTQGERPHDERMKLRADATIRELAERWLVQHIEPKRRERYARECRRMVEDLLTPIHRVRVTELAINTVADLHARLGRTRGNTTANRVLACISAMYGKTAELMGRRLANPCADVEPFREVERNTTLSGDELGRLLKVLPTIGEPWADFFTLLLLTGVRKDCMLKAEWREFALSKAEWTIPATKQKSGSDQVVYLVPAAVEILRRREAVGGHWVFPARSKTGRRVQPNTIWNRIRKIAEIPHVTIHDLRREFATRQAEAGASEAVIGLALGHKPGSRQTARYTKPRADAVRAAVMAAANGIIAIRDGTDAFTKSVPRKGARRA